MTTGTLESVIAFIALTAAIFGWYVVRGRLESGLVAVAFIIGTMALAFGVKYLLGSTRPEGAFLQGPGFPSVHATAATVLFGVWVLSMDRLSWYWFSMAMLAALLIGLSRILIGVHYWGDVLGGWLMGVAALFLFNEVRGRATPTYPT